MVRAPYLRSFLEEKAIYDAQIAPQVQRHVAPHATEIAAMFAALTRVRKPNPDRYPRALASVVSSLTTLGKVRCAWRAGSCRNHSTASSSTGTSRTSGSG